MACKSAIQLDLRSGVGNLTDDAGEITRLLERWQAGEAAARESLLPLVYERLRLIAARQFAGERSGHTLQPTALVNEAFLQIDTGSHNFSDRRHFFALAARTMRHLLVDHARAGSRDKRGGDRLRVTFAETDLTDDAPSADLLDLVDALDELEALNARVAQALELRYFGGLTRLEVAEQLDVSPTTLDRDLRMGRAWLNRRLG